MTQAKIKENKLKKNIDSQPKYDAVSGIICVIFDENSNFILLDVKTGCIHFQRERA